MPKNNNILKEILEPTDKAPKKIKDNVMGSVKITDNILSFVQLFIGQLGNVILEIVTLTNGSKSNKEEETTDAWANNDDSPTNPHNPNNLV